MLKEIISNGNRENISPDQIVCCRWQRIFLTMVILYAIYFMIYQLSFADTNGLVAHWGFDENGGEVTFDNAFGFQDSLEGYTYFTEGVRGAGLKFDGFTSLVIRTASEVPDLSEAFSVMAWIAPQEYSWAWTGIVDIDQNKTAGFSLGINHLGQIGLFAAVDLSWQGCLSKEPVPLLSWSHIAGTYDPNDGFRLYLDGSLVSYTEARGKITAADKLDLFIGMSHRKQYPELTERDCSKQFLSNMVFDGLIDEVSIYHRTLSPREIAIIYENEKPQNQTPLHYRVMPSGPEKNVTFGAYYCRLNYCPEWDRLWRVGDSPDVLVCFEELPVRMVFWRGTGYCPAWVTSNGIWVCDQGPESWNWKTVGCFEQMSDKQCRYSHVRILESTPARAVVHWRTASPGIDYSFNNVNQMTGWGEWTDEYYYIYPDAVAVRYQEIHSPAANSMEWQQTELLNQPGTRPQDNVELDAITIANMQGESETWSWTVTYGKRDASSKPIENGIIQVMNLKSDQRHYVIGEEGARWEPFTKGALEGYSTIPCWNHWPVAQLPNDGRITPVPDRPSSACFGTLYPVKHKTDQNDLMIGRNLYGMTDQSSQNLAELARSWNFPAELLLSIKDFEYEGYDKNQRAYIILKKNSDTTTGLQLTLSGNDKSPILNPAFVIKNWGESMTTLLIDGKTIEQPAFRVGYRRSLESTDLILWINVRSTKTTEIFVR